MPSVDVPNSRKHLLKTACLQQPDADDALYRVRRVAFVPGRQDQSARYRGDDHCDGGDTPQSSSRCKENDYHRRRWSPFKHPLILALLMCGVLACVYVKLPPGLLQRRLTEEVVPTQFESSAISADMERQLASFRQSLADWRQAAAQPAAGAEHLAKLQREYEAMRDQHERAMKQLRTLQDKLVRMETEKQLQADIMSRHEQDELSVLKKQISSLTGELTSLKKEYTALSTSTQKDSKIEQELASKMAKLESKLESRASAPSLSAPSLELANLATSQNGARIVKRFTTPGLADEEHWSYWVGKAAASWFPSGRYQPLMGVQTHPADVVIDEHRIRGPGDCFCVRGPSANVTLDLGLPIYVTSVGIEHAARQLETHRDRAPISVTVHGLRFPEDEKELSREMFKLEMSSKSPDEVIASFEFSYPEVRERTQYVEKVRTQRLRFAVQGQPGSSVVCVYRVKVFGTVTE